MWDRFDRLVAAQGLFDRGETVVVGVSGGQDSMVLLDLLRRRGQPLVTVHVDHGLRETSAADAFLVRDYASTHGLRYRAHTLDPHSRAPGESVQAWARRERYAALEGVASDVGCRVVAVAHHQRDQAETVLLNLLRGAGPLGLAAMPARRPIRHGSAVDLVRPLLDFPKAELEAYAEAHGVPWRDDPGNADPSFRRSMLRTRVMPILREAYGDGLDGVLARNAELAREWTAVIAAVTPTYRGERGADQLPLSMLADLEPVHCRHLLLDWLGSRRPEAPRTRETALRLEGLLNAKPGTRLVRGDIEVLRTRDALVLVSCAEGRAVDDTLPALEVELVDRDAFRPTDEPSVEYVDADLVTVPLAVRLWRDGDRFYPLGGPGERRVSRFLTDCKVPVERKRDVAVVTSGGRIVWVVGLRLDHRFRVTDATSSVLRLRAIPCSESDAG